MVTGRLQRISRAFVAALISATVCLPTNSAQIPVAEAPLLGYAVPMPQLRDGDIILRRGLDLMSRLVLTQGDAARFSHVGLVVLQNDVPYVIHAMPADGDQPGGAIQETLTKFTATSEAAEFAVYRHVDLTGRQRRQISRSAFAQLGMQFDDRFEISNTEKVYCSGLVIRAYASAGLALVGESAAVDVPLLPELVIPPDHLRRFASVPLRLVVASAQ